MHASCGLFVPPANVTDEAERVDCKKCLAYVPVTRDTLAQLVAQLDEAMSRPRHG